MIQYNIKILPQSIQTNAKRGETLLEVLRRCGIPLEAACGGQGSCGRCAIQLIDGECEWPGSKLLTPKILGEKFILACQAKVTQDIVIKVPESTGRGQGVDYTTEVFSLKTVSPDKELSPLSKFLVLDIPEPSFERGMSDLDRLTGQCPGEKIHCTLSVLRSLPAALRQKNGTVTATVIEQSEGYKIIHLEPGVKNTRNFGIACDVGTTTVALQIVDLNTGAVIDTVSSYNEQIECGADIISRIIYAQKKEQLLELNRRITTTINHLIDVVIPKHRILPDEITSGVFSGNTTMTHLLLCINPKYIREDPYVPAVKRVPYLSAEKLGIRINPDAVVYFTPSVGSYVGGDITSGLLYTRMMRKQKGVELFIDIGTNGELVISGEDWMIGCACSAGPAFEGVGIRCGMRASAGAIDSVEIKNGGKEIFCRVIGEGKPQGICGSGLIELVASLLSNCIVSRDGKFNEEISIHRLRGKGKEKAFILYEANQTAHGEEITICEQDITNIMRAKAAIFSASSLLLKKIGLHFMDIETIYVAGGFGHYLNVGKAITIGLFPDIDPNRFKYLGNTSLLGGYLTLLHKDHREHLLDISTKMTYIDLSSEPNYMDEYSAALFLPHTDGSLFPTVTKL